MEVPHKFKDLEFEKYNGTGDPMIHFQMYCIKLAWYAGNEPLSIQTFKENLTAQAAVWFSQLKKLTRWKELVDAFLAQYGHNIHSTLDHFNLQRMENKSGETFQEYAHCWREKAVVVRLPLEEKEMVNIFIDTLKSPYFDQTMGLQLQFFAYLIPIGERVEDPVNSKKIVDI